MLSQKGFSLVVVMIGAGVLLFVSGIWLLYRYPTKSPNIALQPIVQPTREPSSEPSPSLDPSPTSSVEPLPTFKTSQAPFIFKPVDSPTPVSGIRLDSIKTEKENNKLKITLTGKQLGAIENQILLDRSVHNYGYTIISWNPDRIELYASEWVPKNKSVTIAVIGSDGVKSNELSFVNE